MILAVRLYIGLITNIDYIQQYSASSCNALVKKYIGKKYRFHSLRKSCATHLYDLGNDLAKIQDLLGHKNGKTTRIYIKESVKSIKHLTKNRNMNKINFNQETLYLLGKKHAKKENLFLGIVIGVIIGSASVLACFLYI